MHLSINLVRRPIRHIFQSIRRILQPIWCIVRSAQRVCSSNPASGIHHRKLKPIQTAFDVDLDALQTTSTNTSSKPREVNLQNNLTLEWVGIGCREESNVVHHGNHVRLRQVQGLRKLRTVAAADDILPVLFGTSPARRVRPFGTTLRFLPRGRPCPSLGGVAGGDGDPQVLVGRRRRTTGHDGSRICDLEGDGLRREQGEGGRRRHLEGRGRDVGSNVDGGRRCHRRYGGSGVKFERRTVLDHFEGLEGHPATSTWPPGKVGEVEPRHGPLGCGPRMLPGDGQPGLLVVPRSDLEVVAAFVPLEKQARSLQSGLMFGGGLLIGEGVEVGLGGFRTLAEEQGSLVCYGGHGVAQVCSSLGENKLRFKACTFRHRQL